jgi:hypothetical protein
MSPFLSAMGVATPIGVCLDPERPFADERGVGSSKTVWKTGGHVVTYWFGRMARLQHGRAAQAGLTGVPSVSSRFQDGMRAYGSHSRTGNSGS